jgi:hypothetical protein
VRPRHPFLRHISESGDKVILKLKEGTERELASYEELQAVFTAIERRRRLTSLTYLKELTDKQIDKRISDLQKQIDQRLRLRWTLGRRERGLFNYVLIRPLEKQLQAITEEQERRTRR